MWLLTGRFFGVILILDQRWRDVCKHRASPVLFSTKSHYFPAGVVAFALAQQKI